MKLPALVALCVAARGTLAYGAWKGKMNEIAREARNAPRAQIEMIGDLLSLKSNQLTATGRSVQSILQGRETPVDTASAYSAVPDLDSDDCTMDTCCVWKHIADEMYTKFRGESGRCTKYARAAVRLGFHDAASWSKSTGTGGGADGSILLGNELIRAEHDGLQDVGIVIKKWYDKYHRDYGVGMADLIQMGSNVATVTCPLGPRVRTYVGRPDSTKPAPSGLMPDPNDSADKLIELFRNKTITPDGLIALIGAHTTSQQHFFNQNRDGAPQDSTPGVWDINFYGETKGNAPKRVLKLPSDIALSKNPATAAIWDAFASRVGQEAWNLAYAREYIRLSLLGVYNINDLTECTKVLPMPVTSFSPPDQDAVNQWLNGKEPPSGVDVGGILEGGGVLSVVGGLLGGILGGGQQGSSGNGGQRGGGNSGGSSGGQRGGGNGGSQRGGGNSGGQRGGGISGGQGGGQGGIGGVIGGLGEGVGGIVGGIGSGIGGIIGGLLGGG